MNQDNKPSANKIIASSAQDMPESAPNANEGIMRRDWLKNALIGGMGLGLFGLPMPTFAGILPTTCPRMTRVSKNLAVKTIEYSCTPCECNKVPVYRIKLDFSKPASGIITNNTVCDKSSDVILAQSTATGIITFLLTPGTCPKTGALQLYGSHEGTINIFHPSGAQILTLTLEGTYGVDPRASLDARCCWPNAQGTLKGTGLDKLKGCTLCATYYIPIQFVASDPCKNPVKSLAMQFDGSLMCPC
jgi:hypothetical protein